MSNDQLVDLKVFLTCLGDGGLETADFCEDGVDEWTGPPFCCSDKM